MPQSPERAISPSPELHPYGAPRRRTRSGKILILLVMGLVLATGSVGGWLFLNDEAGSADVSADVHVVERGRFEVMIPASGELAAVRQVEIVNKLESRSIITEIVDEGTMVRAGDLLFRLADEEIRNRIKDAEDAVTAAEAGLASAESNLAIRRSSAESDTERADLQILLAGLALEAWTEGELPSKRKSLAVALETAKINYERLEQKFQESERLLADDHISRDEYERDRIAKIEARARYETAVLDIDVYEKYQFFQDQALRTSDLEQATAERDRVIARNEAEINSAVVGLETSRNRLTSARERLADLERQLTYCEVFAPSGGLVVYASSMESSRRGNNEQGIQVGTELRPNETVIILPDTSQMVAAVRVNEALTGQVRPGQRARVVSDALPNLTLEGEVLSIGVLAEQTGWRDPNRREYTVRVLLTNATNEMGLKPSMRCRGEIIVDTVTDAIHVPIQSIFRRGSSAHVFVSDAGRIEQRAVRTGRASELWVEVLGGVDTGDRVLLREPASDELRRGAELAGSNGDGSTTGSTNGSTNGARGRPPRGGLAEGG